MADEYIKRRDAIDHINDFVRVNKFYHPHSNCKTIPIAEAISRIYETPSADVQEVRHGEWKEDSRPSFGCQWYFRKCSVCGYQRDDCDPCLDSYFCPNCGSDLRKEKHD